MMKIVLLILLLASSSLSFAGYPGGKWDASLGMQSVSLAENAGAVQGSDAEEAASVSFSTIVLMVKYNLKYTAKRSFFINGVVPMQPSVSNSVFLVGGGVDFYLRAISSVADFEDKGTHLILTPKTQYYWGPEVMVGSVTYSTEPENKNDITVQIGAHGGMIYRINDKYAIKAEGAFFRNVGIVTSAQSMRFLVGLVFDI